MKACIAFDLRSGLGVIRRRLSNAEALVSSHQSTTQQTDFHFDHDRSLQVSLYMTDWL